MEDFRTKQHPEQMWIAQLRKLQNWFLLKEVLNLYYLPSHIFHLILSDKKLYQFHSFWRRTTAKKKKKCSWENLMFAIFFPPDKVIWILLVISISSWFTFHLSLISTSLFMCKLIGH